MAGQFHCTIVTPERQLLDQTVTYASIPAWDGQIGVQDRRSPLLVKLGFGRLRLTLDDGSQQNYFVGGGFAQMKDETLTLLTDEAQPVSELDAEAAREALKQARNESAAGDTEIDRRERRQQRARAILELSGAK
jgi:F-type H+-transporting ATPase subunit epsilon